MAKRERPISKFQTKAVYLLIILHVFAGGCAVSSRTEPEPCTLDLSKAPKIRGLRLGMTLDEANDLFPKKISLDKLHSSAVIEFINDEERGENFKGVRRVELRFTKNQLTYIYVEYPDYIDWKDGEFYSRMSEHLGLSSQEAWQRNPLDKGIYGLECDGFTVEIKEPRTIDYGTRPGETRLPPSVSISERKAKQMMKEQQDAIEADRKRKFNP